MFAHERHHKIAALLERRPQLAVSELQRLLGASPATLRRDLAHLERAGRLVRTHGGVMHATLAGEPQFERKLRTAAAAKSALAACAARLVAPGATVFLDAGTTTLELGRALLREEGLTLFTNSLPLLTERHPGKSRLVTIGGEPREVSRALVGSLALDWLRHLRFEIAFIGASGLDAVEGASTTELMEAAVKKELLGRARRRVLVADATKWNQPAAVRFAAWDEFTDFVTDADFTRTERERLKQAGLALHTT